MMNSSALCGFRLDRLEVYNWGTFHDTIHVVPLTGQNALWTGSNRAGKTTLVDALLTLMVSSTRRHYNQAAGAAKTERSELSYVRGEWKAERDEENGEEIAQYLRGEGSYSVILAIFEDVSTHQVLTIASVLWYQDQKIHKFYILARHPLHIEEHFVVDQGMHELRRSLRTLEGVDIYTHFEEYVHRFWQLIGVRSEKAVTLFLYLIASKEVGNIGEYIRLFLLDERESIQEIDDAWSHFENLTQVHQKIEEAIKQVEMLEPLVSDAQTFASRRKKCLDIEQCQAYLPLFIATCVRRLLEPLLEYRHQEILHEKSEANALEHDVALLHRRMVALEASLQTDRIGLALDEMQRAIDDVLQQYEKKKAQWDTYVQLVVQAEQVIPHDRSTFDILRHHMSMQQDQTQTKQNDLVTQRDEQKADEHMQLTLHRALREEIVSLQQRQTQIPKSDIDLRSHIAEALQIPIDVLPFAGELLRVHASEVQWEPALERLLFPFARRLLVLEKDYAPLSRYVDEHNLRQRLAYHRVTDQERGWQRSVSSGACAYDKIEIKPETPFTAWLEMEVKRGYGYLCCENLEDLKQTARAISLNGQIKHSSSYHEKDDRRPFGLRTDYILGWTNTEKIAALEQEYKQSGRHLTTRTTAIRSLEEEQKQLKEKMQLFAHILSFESFDAMDYQPDYHKTQTLRAERQLVEASSDHLVALKRQVSDVQLRHHEKTVAYQKALVAVATQETQWNTIRKKQQTCDEVIQQTGTEPCTDVFARILHTAQKRKWSFENIDTIEHVREEVRLFYHGQVSSLKQEMRSLEDRIEERMRMFQRAYSLFAQESGTTMESLDEYLHLHQQICDEDLPDKRSRFKKLLNEKVIVSMSVFKAVLEQQVEDDKKQLEKFNALLHPVKYRANSFLQLHLEPTRKSEIRDFKQLLRTCLPDVGDESEEAVEASFQRIQHLLLRFKKEEAWAQKVTDVRNWFDFSVEERSCTDNIPLNIYSDSSGMSGGERAKLTHTLLVTAIAYQYGLEAESDQEHSFRLVILDEAFNRSDDENAHFVLALFRQFDLQLIAITPHSKTHIIEQYVRTCHLVTNNEHYNDSWVFTLTIDEFLARKKTYNGGNQA